MGTAQVRVTGCAVQGGRGGRCDRQQRDGALRTSSHAMNSIAPPTLDSQTSVSIIADSVSKTGKSLKTVFRYDIGTIPSISTTRIKKSSARWQKKREKQKESCVQRAPHGVSRPEPSLKLHVHRAKRIVELERVYHTLARHRQQQHLPRRPPARRLAPGARRGLPSLAGPRPRLPHPENRRRRRLQQPLPV